MKHRIFKAIALTLAAVLLCALAGAAEDSVVVDFAPASGMDEAIDGAYEDTQVELDDAEALDLWALSTDEIMIDGDGFALDEGVPDESFSTAANKGSIPAELTLGVKESYALNTNMLGKNVTFKTSKPKIASVNSKGVVTGKKKGNATITVLSGKKKVASCKVTVLAAPKKVSLGITSIAIGVKESVKLVPTIPQGSHASFTWSAKHQKIATVSQSGVIKGKKVGKTTVTVKTHNGKKSVIKVTVAKAPDKISLNQNSAALNIGETFQLKATLPKKTASRITWSSSNTEIVAVNESGLVSAVGPGEAIITARTYNKKSTTCSITVNQPVQPTTAPTAEPTPAPTAEPTSDPTATPTSGPTIEPTPDPTAEPTPEPTAEPTSEPTAEPTSEPTTEPTSEPTAEPTSEPTAEPTSDPTPEPTKVPSPLDNPHVAQLANALGVNENELEALTGLSGEALYALTENDIQALIFYSDNIFWKPNSQYTGVIIHGCIQQRSIIEINAKYCNLPVIGIADAAFDGDETLEELRLPSTVTRIGRRAFRGCVRLRYAK